MPLRQLWNGRSPLCLAFAAAVLTGCVSTTPAPPVEALAAEPVTVAEAVAVDPVATAAPQAGWEHDLVKAIVGAVRSEEAAGIAETFEEMAELNPTGALDAPLLTHQDLTRLATELESNPQELRSAAAILLTLPGAPVLYDGEEIGLQNGAGGKDELEHAPANVAAQQKDPGSLFHHYRRLIAARKASPALRQGKLELLTRGNVASPTLAFLRHAPEETVLVVHNLKKEKAVAGPFQLDGQMLEPLLLLAEKTETKRDATGWTITLPAGGSAVWRVGGTAPGAGNP